MDDRKRMIDEAQPDFPRPKETWGRIATKFRRALRNETGANFTFEQLRDMASSGILHTLVDLEAEELCPATTKLATLDNGTPSREAMRKPLAPTATPTKRGPLCIRTLSKGL